MKKDDNKLCITGDRNPEPCDAYKDGFCMEVGKPCDMCYESSMKLFKEK